MLLGSTGLNDEEYYFTFFRRIRFPVILWNDLLLLLLLLLLILFLLILLMLFLLMCSRFSLMLRICPSGFLPVLMLTRWRICFCNERENVNDKIMSVYSR